MEKTSKIFRAMLDVVLPPVCYVCKEPCRGKYGLCDDCLDKIHRLPHSAEPQKTAHLDEAWFACRYKETIKECVHLFKYNGYAGLVDIFRDIAVNFIRKNGLNENIDLLVPVPAHRTKRREKNYSHTDLLARAISQELSIPLDSRNLKKIRWTRPQSELDKEKRLVNVKNSFLAVEKNAFCGKKILLIDDVYTTGSTANECAKALREARANRVFSFAIAR